MEILVVCFLATCVLASCVRGGILHPGDHTPNQNEPKELGKPHGRRHAGHTLTRRGKFENNDSSSRLQIQKLHLDVQIESLGYPGDADHAPFITIPKENGDHAPFITISKENGWDLDDGGANNDKNGKLVLIEPNFVRRIEEFVENTRRQAELDIMAGNQTADDAKELDVLVDVGVDGISSVLNTTEFRALSLPNKFELYDKDGDWFLTLGELISSTGAKENAALAFHASDTDGDGQINEDEFYSAPWCLNGENAESGSGSGSGDAGGDDVYFDDEDL